MQLLAKWPSNQFPKPIISKKKKCSYGVKLITCNQRRETSRLSILYFNILGREDPEGHIAEAVEDRGQVVEHVSRIGQNALQRHKQICKQPTIHPEISCSQKKREEKATYLIRMPAPLPPPSPVLYHSPWRVLSRGRASSWPLHAVIPSERGR